MVEPSGLKLESGLDMSDPKKDKQRDDVLKRMLNTPPESQKPQKDKSVYDKPAN